MADARRRSPHPQFEERADVDESVHALADDCPSFAGVLARTSGKARLESERDAVHFIATKRDMDAAIAFLATAEARLTNAR